MVRYLGENKELFLSFYHSKERKSKSAFTVLLLCVLEIKGFSLVLL